MSKYEDIQNDILYLKHRLAAVENASVRTDINQDTRIERLTRRVEALEAETKLATTLTARLVGGPRDGKLYPLNRAGLHEIQILVPLPPTSRDAYFFGDPPAPTYRVGIYRFLKKAAVGHEYLYEWIGER